MSKTEAAAQNSISMYHAFQEIKGEMTLCFQEAYTCRERPNAEQNIGVSLVSHEGGKRKQHASGKRHTGEQEVARKLHILVINLELKVQVLFSLTNIMRPFWKP